jgi:ATPase subunit of ABC transporter with duplicated ATPase domains
MDTHQIDAWASATFDDSVADELLGFTPLIEEASPPRETGSARVARERRAAALRQRRSRANRAKAAELDGVIADALRTLLIASNAATACRTKEGMRAARVSLHNLLGEAMNALVLDYGYNRDEAAKAVTGRLMR